MVNVVDDTTVITVPLNEGNASIIDVKHADNFTPGVWFQVMPRIKNIGESDTLFAGLYNDDTGEMIKDPDLYTFYTSKDTIWEMDWRVTLTQNYDFKGRIEVGHVEGGLNIVDASRVIGVKSGYGPIPCEDYLLKGECEAADCYWYPYPPWNPPSCHDKSMLIAYGVPIAVVGVGVIVIAAAIRSRRIR